MHESSMANQDSEILPNQDCDILPEDAEDTPCDFNELVSTMQPDCLTDTLSVYLESCEPLSVTDNDPDPSHNVDEPNTDSLVDPFNSIVLTESSEVRDNHVQNIKCSSTRRSTRKVASNQKTDTKLAARKSRRASGKKPMLDLLSADVGRRRRSNLILRARPSAWGVGGKIDEIFKKNVNVNANANANEDVEESIKGRTGHKGGKRNTKKGLLLKFKVGTKAIQNCQFNTIPSIDHDLESYTEVKIETSTLQSDIKENYEKEVPSASNENLDKRSDDLGVGESVENGCSDPGTSPDSEVINVIPETQTAEGLHSHQSSDCGVGSAIPSPEIVNVNDVLSCDKFDHGEKQVEGSGSPRSAWVCCDDCHKWRRISAILADSIESTECRWICKDNMDKTFGDCSIPQEKSNADINEELELSEASGEEDASNTQLNSSQSGQKQQIDPPQLSWKLIKTNMFLHRNRKNQTIDEIMVCHCKPSLDGRMGCRDECLNRMLNIECVKGTCPCGDLCSNQQFQKRKYSKLKCFPCGKKGFGLQLQEDIPKGRFLIEYVGEVLDMPAYEARQKEYARKGHKHFYFMTLNGSEVIDACAKGNLGRFINHSCQPNCRTEKWMVNGEVCIGLFAIRDIQKGEELTFDYNYVRVFGAAAKKCVCGSSRCRGVIGGDPLSSETVVSGDSDDEFPEPVTFYENHNNNKLDNLLITETQSASKNNSPVTDKFSMTPGHSEDVENENDSLLAIDDDKNTVVPIGSTTEREVSFERSSSESKIDVSFNKVTDVKHSESKKKPKANKNGNKCVILKPQSRPKQPSSLVKRGKSKNHKPPEIIDTKPLPLPPHKPKRIGEATLTGRFEAVQEALNTLLNADGGISKRRDAWKGYLKLLCLTAHSGNGEGIQSNRDLSMILDALLKTKSRTVLFDIINKNGLQMLHNLIKHYKKEFIKIPILRKLLKVLEFLAEGKILTLENILKPSPNGAISFKESILSLTEHTDKQVHQIARNFRDKWIPWYARKVVRADRDRERMEPHSQPTSNFKTFQGQNSHSTDRRLPEVSDNSIKPPLTVHTPPVEASAASCVSSCTDGTRIRTRKRKSRWDQPGDITTLIPDIALVTNESQQHGQTKNDDMDEDAPPGFSSPVVNRQLLFASTSGDPVKGHLQDRYNSWLPTAFGLPSSVLRQIGIPPEGAATAESWVVAPAMTFHPFPPLPMYPRHVNEEQSWRGCTDNDPPGFQRFRNPNTLGRRYYKQHKWNNSRSGLPWGPNKYGPGPGPNYVGPNQGYGGNEGYNNNNNNNGVGSFYGGGGETHTQR
ncbi:histone-lysine N-methyltransferase ASHH2 [Lactuca sativa]|uniref:Histone-lysine N-methyltransferase n=1 Tax=Lactuca sativa TaxID=4236 RepID=A0A9R1X845_LACSA|nr:histone-lysine N-methyltransferase ASHH2 [Lactuca sativa]XP_023731849.1 histone-lysine N-methyltransferase ASHH2 [Lactuca sativa]KAJ0202329.1 hypothetical protein LSAT_V11C600339350 [Lactuca sativa]